MAIRDGSGDEARIRKTSPGRGQTEDAPLLLDINQDAIGSSAEQTPWALDSAFDGLPWWKTPSIWWLIPGFFVYALAFGGIMVPRLNLALTLICRDYLSHEAMQHPDLIYLPVEIFAENPQCRIPEVQALSTKFVLYMSLILGTCCAAASPKIGSLSDRYGRRWLLCLTILGGVLNEIITIACASRPDTFHYRWLLLGAFFDGACGSFIAAMAVTHSYATDCTAPHDRGVAFGYIQACLFGGIAVGPFIAAFMQRSTGTQMTVFYFALVCHLGFMLYLAFFVPESLSNKKQSRAQTNHEELLDQAEEQTTLQRLNPLALFEPLSVMYPRGQDYKQVRRNLVLLAILSFTIFGVNMGAGPVLVFYSIYAWAWTDFDIQMFVGWTSATRVFSLIAILPLINYVFRTLPNKRARKRGEIVAKPKSTGSDNVDLYTIAAGFLIEVIQYILFCLATSGKLFFAAGVIGSFAGVGSPIISSALSKHVPQNEMGKLMGAIGLLHALGRVICPTVFSLIYANTVGFWPQLVFIFLAACFAAGFVATLFVKPHVPLPGITESSSGVESEAEADSDREARFRNEVRREELDDEEYDHVRG